MLDSSSKLSSNPMCLASDSHDQHCHTPQDAKIARRALLDESVKKSCSDIFVMMAPLWALGFCHHDVAQVLDFEVRKGGCTSKVQKMCLVR